MILKMKRIKEKDENMNKIWQPIEQALKNPEAWPHNIYYVGGTLCVDMKRGFVAMNLDGRGFTSAGVLVLPKPIHQLVKETYIKIKGNTRHYQEEVSNTCN